MTAPSLDDFVADRATGVRHAPATGAPAGYLDGAERRLLKVLRSARDRSVGSAELAQHIADWPTLYHLTPYRTTILDALGFTGAGDASVLELGAGCGAITRWLGEHFASVRAVEGDPMRATVARARCAELGSVDVFAANYSELAERDAFDVVTLIGVLEYGHLYHPTLQDPAAAALANLRVARQAMTADGVLVLAIENRLGLKYLNGAREDHSGKIHESVEGYPHARSAVTFSRLRLTQMLREAGFGDVATYLPYPDYKLASTVIAADAVGPEDGVHNWLPATAPDRGHHGRAVAHYHEALAQREVAEAGLLPDLANSLLLVAYAGDRAATDARLGIETGWRARHYSLSRTAGLGKRATITAAVEGVVRNEPAFGVKPTGGTDLVSHTLADEPLAAGELAVFAAHEAVAGTGVGPELTAMATAHAAWLEQELGTGEHDGDGVPLLDGVALDAAWWNVVRALDGTRTLIDREWRCAHPLPVDFVTSRTALHYALRWGIHLPAPFNRDPSAFAAELVRRVHPETTVHRLGHLRALDAILDRALHGEDPAPEDPTLAKLADPSLARHAGLDARAFVVLIDAEEAIVDPDLVQAFADAFDATSGATLVLCADGWDDGRIAADLGPVLTRAGLDDDGAADVLAVPVAPVELITDAHALLTAAPTGAPLSALHRIRAGGSGVLRELERQQRLGVPAPA